jgi:sulfur carrier protein
MNLTVNGKPAVIAGHQQLSISELLAELQVAQADYVTVELNGEILDDRAAFPTTIVRDGDKVEFLYFMGGGR